MFVNQVIATQGIKVLWEGTIREAAFAILYEGVDGEWDEAQRRAAEIGQQCVEDWLRRMSERGRIEWISPTHIQLFDRSEEEEAVLHHVLNKEAPKKAARPPEGSMQEQAVKLIFDATGSQDRMNRIMRGFEETYSFVHQENGDWSCMNHEGKAYRLYVDLENSTGACTCLDFMQRGAKLKMPCKHIYGFVVQTVNWKNPEEQQREWDVEAANGEAFRKGTENFLKKNTDFINGHHYTKKGFFTGGVKEQTKKEGTL